MSLVLSLYVRYKGVWKVVKMNEIVDEISIDVNVIFCERMFHEFDIFIFIFIKNERRILFYILSSGME